LNQVFTGFRSIFLFEKFLGNVLTKATESEAKLESSDFHPDGLFFGVGTSTGGVKIWDIRNRVEVAPFGGHSGAVNALAFRYALEC
jgi:pre-mRNA-processing factor 19